MNASHRNMVIAGFAGLLFALGLSISGMVQPSRVIAFLHLGKDWDPSLIFVMVGALAVFAPGYWWSTRSSLMSKAGAKAGMARVLPPPTTVDRRLVIGASLFGLGWGLAGYCPGPALSSLSYASPQLLVFVATMLASMWFARRRPTI